VSALMMDFPKRKFPSNFFLSLALGNGSTGPPIAAAISKHRAKM